MGQAIRRLDQVRALSAPLRLRIMDALGSDERTVMQIAGMLRRTPTGLYHHVRVLERAGLVRQVRSQQKRGTIERYYRAVHSELRIDPTVFSGRGAARARRDVATGVLEAAELDLRRLMRPTAHPMIALRLALDLDAARLGEVESVLRTWAQGHARKARSPYRLTIVAHHAIDAPPEASAPTPRTSPESPDPHGAARSGRQRRRAE